MKYVDHNKTVKMTEMNVCELDKYLAKRSTKSIKKLMMQAITANTEGDYPKERLIQMKLQQLRSGLI